MNTVVCNVRPWGGPASDIEIVDGIITAVRASEDAAAAPGTADPAARIDGRGLLALPAFVNAHAHADKTWWGQPWVPFAEKDTTDEFIANERAVRDRYAIPSEAGAVRVLRESLRQGVTAMRSHVDVDLGVGLDGIAHVRAAAAALDGAIDVRIVAFPQDGVMRRPGVLELLDRAAAEGADAVGGVDPAGIDRDPAGQIDGLFDIAERRGVGIDIHLHDHGELGAFQFELIADRALRSGLGGRVTISHGFALGELPESRQRALIERFAEAGVSWATAAPAYSTPLPWREMLAHGVGIGIGTDGIRDLWNPFGDGDVLRMAYLFAKLHDLRADEDLVQTMRFATSAGAPYVGRTTHDLVPGARADLVLVDAENVPDALVRVPPRELVLSAGRVVAERGELRI